MQKYVMLGMCCSMLLACAGKDGNDDCGGLENPGGPVSTPNEEVCADTSDWDPSWAALEQGIVDAVNERRTIGATCGGETFSCTHPLVMDPALRCGTYRRGRLHRTGCGRKHRCRKLNC